MTTHEVVLPLFSQLSSPVVKRYRTVVADPPWAAVTRPPRRFDGNKNDHNSYGTMTDEQLMCMPVGLWAEENSHLYLWCLNSNIFQAHKVAKAWGFEVKTLLTWTKGRLEVRYNEQGKPYAHLVQHIGLGHYFRNSTEHVLFAVRGSLPTRRDDLPTSFIAARGEHSEKPASFYDLVTSMSPGPYLDVFARVQRWVAGASFEVMDTFGNEAFNFGTSLPPEHFVKGSPML